MAGAAKGKSKANQYSNVPDNVAEEYTRNQMQDAAKMGAAAGASRQRQQRRQGAVAQQQQNSSATAYNQAYGSCMAAKGFPGGL
jgi:mannose/cellobiose epimerase-like protein (N-acyl-D-glucosamine 2-epimerase family)